MANTPQSPTNTPTIYDPEWSCKLLPSSQQVGRKDQGTLTVTLCYNTRFDDLPPKDKIAVYTEGFNFKFTNSELGKAVDDAYRSRRRPSAEGINFSFTVPPDIQGGALRYRCCWHSEQEILGRPPIRGITASSVRRGRPS